MTKMMMTVMVMVMMIMMMIVMVVVMMMVMMMLVVVVIIIMMIRSPVPGFYNVLSSPKGFPCGTPEKNRSHCSSSQATDTGSRTECMRNIINVLQNISLLRL